MELTIRGIQVKAFHFFNIEEIEDADRERIKKREDGLEIVKFGNITTENDEEFLRIIAKTNFKFTFDNRYYFIGDLAGSFSIPNVTESEFKNQEKQIEFIHEALSSFTAKFDMLVGIFSQEVYSATRIPERTSVAIEKS